MTVAARRFRAGPAAGEGSYRATFLALSLALGSYAMLQTAVVPALPALQRDLHTNIALVTWTFTGFMLVSAVATPIVGKLGDLYGKERMLLVTIAFFFVGCVGSVFATNIWTLIVVRALQGIGGGIFALVYAIVKDEFPEDRLQGTIGFLSALTGVGGGLGFVMSGLMIDHLSWRWLFGIGSIPIGLGFLAVHFFVPESPIKSPARLDIPGAVLLSASLVTLLLALTEAHKWGWTSARILGLFAVAALLAALWLRVELRVPEPLVDVRMLADRVVALTNLCSFLMGFAIFTSFILVPQFVETPHARGGYGFGATNTEAALYLLGGTATGFVSGLFAGRITRRFGRRLVLAAGLGVTALGYGFFALFHDQVWQVVVAQAVAGAGFPFAMAVVATTIVSSVRPTETGVATGMNNVLRLIGQVIGAQLVAAILESSVRRGVPAEHGFTISWTIGAVFAVVAMVVAAFIPTQAGRSPRRPALAEP